MSWIEKILGTKSSHNNKANIPKGIWTKCNSCQQILYAEDLKRNMQVCPKCDHHMRISARTRLLNLLDKESVTEISSNLEPQDILKFRDLKKYKDRLNTAQKQTGEKEALIAMSGTLYQMPIVVAAFDFTFMGGSMGTIVGEKFVVAAQKALDDKIPFICFSASGGARMQEALFSLMQMAKTSAILAKLKEAGIPFISVMTDPTFGGVSASFAMLGDIHIAEPKALIGFAGARVIEQTVREKLPEGFQRAEFLLEHGALDMIVHRRDMRDTLAGLVAKMTNQPSPFEVKPFLIEENIEIE